jgi:integrase/recombinase XerC
MRGEGGEGIADVIDITGEILARRRTAPLAAGEILELGGERVRSAHSRRAYQSSFKALALFLGSPNEEAALTALLGAGSRGAEAIVLRFRKSLLEKGLAPASVNVRLSALKSAARLARMSGTTEWDLVVPLVRSEPPRRETRGPSVEDIGRLLEVASEQESEEKAARDVALLRLLYDLGLRRSEVVGLNVGDVDVKRRSLAVRRKGGVLSLLELPEETAAALGGWLRWRSGGAGEGDQSRGVLGAGAAGALFVELSPKGERRRLAAGGVYFVVRRLGEELGLRVRPHGLRHSSITAAVRVAAERGLPLPEVLSATGHAPGSLRLVMAYYDLATSRQGELARLVAGGVWRRPQHVGTG